MTATVLDDRRRLVLPPEFPARAAVTIQHIDQDTILVRRHRDEKVAVIVVPIIKELPSDPEWEKKEAALAKHTFKRMAPFEE